MIFVGARPSAGGITVSYYIEHEKKYDYEFSRIRIGMSFPDETDPRRVIGRGFVTVVGERLFQHKDKSERIFIPIDEDESPTTNDLIGKVIEFKDLYLCDSLYCPKSPQSIVEHMQRTEGLTHYRDRTLNEYRKQWPNFVGKDHRCSILTTDLDSAVMHRELETIRTTKAIDPKDGHEIIDSDFKPINRLIFPDGFNNKKTRSGLISSSEPVVTALWNVVRGLDRSFPITEEPESEFSGDRTTGY